MSCENSRNWLLHSLMEKSAFILIRYVMEDMYRYYSPLPGMCSFNTKTKQDQSRDKLTILRNCFPCWAPQAGFLAPSYQHHLLGQQTPSHPAETSPTPHSDLLPGEITPGYFHGTLPVISIIK